MFLFDFIRFCHLILWCATAIKRCSIRRVDSKTPILVAPLYVYLAIFAYVCNYEHLWASLRLPENHITIHKMTKLMNQWTYRYRCRSHIFQDNTRNSINPSCAWTKALFSLSSQTPISVWIANSTSLNQASWVISRNKVFFQSPFVQPMTLKFVTSLGTNHRWLCHGLSILPIVYKSSPSWGLRAMRRSLLGRSFWNFKWVGKRQTSWLCTSKIPAAGFWRKAWHTQRHATT